MVRGLIARDDPRAIVIKPHPLDTDPDTRRFLRRMAGRDARVQVLEANIHDILAQASVTVTINSAVGLESLLHRVPVVLCGRTDFHHGCRTATDAASLDAEIGQAAARPVPFDAYLYWYLGLNCLNAGSPRLLDDFLGRVAATGFGISQAK
nr:hypothetical protein [Szabonella alba]